jgi:hypothetical protein
MPGLVAGSEIFVGFNGVPGFSLPSGITTAFGSGTGAMNEEGNIYRYVSAGINPAATGADNVLAVYTMPASSFDIPGRGINLVAQGSFAANGNTKRVKIFVGCTTAVIGSTVTGGIAIADSAAVTTNGAGWALEANLFKYGVTGSNTQLGLHQSAQSGSTISPLLSPQLLTLTENAVILVAVTGNPTTTATDISLAFFEVNAMN